MTLDANQRAKLDAAGWRVGTAADFLDLTPDEAEAIERRLREHATHRH